MGQRVNHTVAISAHTTTTITLTVRPMGVAGPAGLANISAGMMPSTATTTPIILRVKPSTWRCSR